MTHYVPKVACINDLSGYGRCSLSTAISILSVCGVQPCAAPTAVFSKHSGFENFHFTDLSSSLEPFLQSWNDLCFDGIYTGFLGSDSQISVVKSFIERHKAAQQKTPLVVVDTVMGDNGRLYSTYTKQMCKALKSLVAVADVITPNVTEACFLTDTEYCGDAISDEFCRNLCAELKGLGAKSVVITGIRRNDSIVNFVADDDDEHICPVHRTDNVFSGTGDIFSSIVTAFLICGKSLRFSVEAASSFISKATQYTLGMKQNLANGVIFEPLLNQLEDML